MREDGTIFVGLRDHIEVFDAKGQRQTVWDSPGKKCWLTALAVSKGDVFAADSGDRVVLRYDKSGNSCRALARRTRSARCLASSSPARISTWWSRAMVCCASTIQAVTALEAYTLSGDFEGLWGKPAMGIEGFCGCCNPVGLAMLPDGRFVTCEKGLPRVKIYSDQGQFEWWWRERSRSPRMQRLAPT